MDEQEAALLSRYAQERDPDAFRALVEVHQHMVYAACRRILGNREDALDDAQGCFLKLALNAARLRAPVAGWLHRVAVRLSLNARRDKSLRRARETEAALLSGRSEPVWEDLRPEIDGVSVSRAPETGKLCRAAAVSGIILKYNLGKAPAGAREAGPAIRKGEDMDRQFIRWAAILLALCSFAVPGRARADTLSYRHGPPAELRKEVPNPGTALRALQATTVQPAGLAALPDLSAKSQYVSVSLGEGPTEFWAIHDQQANEGVGALYFDTDGDSDFAEEEPVKPQRVNGTESFGPISVELTRGGSTGPYHFYIRRYLRGTGKDYWRLSPACYNVGDVTIGDKAYRMAVTDGAANGVFNDLWNQTDSWSDHAYVDWNGDGTFGSGESLYCTRLYTRDGQWYEVSFSADGLDVSFTPAEFPMGTVTFDGDLGLTAQFVSGTGQGGFIAGGRGRIEVPADDYGILRWWGTRAADDGVTWQVTGSRTPPTKVAVRAGEETEVVIGEPFKASLTASGKPPYRWGASISFQAKLAGADDKDYRFQRGNTEMPAPKMVLRDESGKQVGSHAFEYG